MSAIPVHDLIGLGIKCVLHADVNQSDRGFHERRVLVELENVGLLEIDQQSEALSRKGGAVLVCCPERPQNAVVVLDQETNPELGSPVTGVFVPFGWDASIGLKMQNGFVVHTGFSMNDNGAMLYRPSASTLAEFSFIAGS